MPLFRRNKGQANPEPVLSKHEVIEEVMEELQAPVNVVIEPPVVVIDDKKPKKDK